jgi:hypothetical protein
MSLRKRTLLNMVLVVLTFGTAQAVLAILLALI